MSFVTIRKCIERRKVWLDRRKGMTDLTNGRIEVGLIPMKVTIGGVNPIHGTLNLTSQGVEVRLILVKVTNGRVKESLTPMKVTIVRANLITVTIL